MCCAWFGHASGVHFFIQMDISGPKKGGNTANPNKSMVSKKPVKSPDKTVTSKPNVREGRHDESSMCTRNTLKSDIKQTTSTVLSMGSVRSLIKSQRAERIKSSSPTTIPSTLLTPSQSNMDSVNEVNRILTQNNYRMVRYIDKGATAHVYKVVNAKGEFFAAKVIDHRKQSSSTLHEYLPNELKILRQVNHPNIIRAEDMLCYTNYTIIVTEFASDGDLITIIEKVSEPNVPKFKLWMKDVVQAVVYLHSMGIAHRDIKGDNVFICNGVAKLGDFGYARFCWNPHTNKPKLSNQFCGTLEYRAPETLMNSQPFDPFIADCFSLGVMLYALVTLEFPFFVRNHSRMSYEGILQLYNDMKRKNWASQGEVSKDRRLFSLLKQLLNPDIDERITADQILHHPWFKERPENTAKQ